jgi:hypothetical protein
MLSTNIKAVLSIAEKQQGHETVIDDTLASPSRIICIAVDESEFSHHGKPL